MADPIKEIISAFAAGCIDKANFVQFKEYINAGGEIPVNELGELQNIVSMIPIILDLEQPNPSIKDNIAKKLIGLKEEIKTKIIEEKKKTIVSFGDDSIIPEPVAPSKHTYIENPLPHPLTITENWKKTSIKDESSDNKKSTIKETGAKLMTDNQPQSLFNSQPQQQQQVYTPPSQDKGSSGFAGWIAIILVILLFTILGYYTYTSIDTLNNQVEDLKHDITSLRSELATANNFMSTHISLIEFFNYKDVAISNLTSINPAEKGSARVFLAFDQKEGLIQFKNTIPLQPNQGLQLWVVSRGQSYSLGVYTPNDNEYTRLTTFPFLPKEQIDLIKLTIESNTGSPTPSVQTYLQGSLGR